MTFQPDLCADVPIVGLVGSTNFDDLLADEPMAGHRRADPAAPALIAFTSGTTSNPKGVIHSHQTLGFETRQLLENYPPDRGRQLTATPVGHFIGMLGAFLIPVLEGAPDRSVRRVGSGPGARADRSATASRSAVGRPTSSPACSTIRTAPPEHLRHFTTVGLGGSTVPAAVTRRLADLGMFVFRSYGSTEHPSITGSRRSAPEDKRLFTDGNVRPGVEIRLGPRRRDLQPRAGSVPRLHRRSELTAAAFDEDGWYRTGDVGVLDDDGYLTITDRKADVIIRGGENISALEVEEVLLAMPPSLEAVVVAAPDARLGERAAAVLRLQAGSAMPTLDEVRAHFEAAGVRAEVAGGTASRPSDFPRTASGKVQKFRVRQHIRQNAIATSRRPCHRDSSENRILARG